MSLRRRYLPTAHSRRAPARRRDVIALKGKAYGAKSAPWLFLHGAMTARTAGLRPDAAR
jgi:hypothetical protein